MPCLEVEGIQARANERQSMRLGLLWWYYLRGPRWLLRLSRLVWLLTVVLCTYVWSTKGFVAALPGAGLALLGIFLACLAFVILGEGFMSYPILETERQVARLDRRVGCMERLRGALQTGTELTDEIVLYLRPFDADFSSHLELADSPNPHPRYRTLHLEDYLAELMSPWGDLVVLAPPKSMKSMRLPRIEERASSHIEAPDDDWFHWFSRLARHARYIILLPYAVEAVRNTFTGLLPREVAEGLKDDPRAALLAEGLAAHLLGYQDRSPFNRPADYQGTVRELVWLLEEGLSSKVLFMLPPRADQEMRHQAQEWLSRQGVVWELQARSERTGDEGSGRILFGLLSSERQVHKVGVCGVPTAENGDAVWRENRKAMRGLLRRPLMRRRLLAGLESPMPYFL